MPRWVNRNRTVCFFQSHCCCSYQNCFCSPGDCDSDDDCEGFLICFFRGFYDDVPGCLGAGEEDHDCCVDPFLTPVLAAEAPSNTSSFQLKLYWQEGYTWQEVRSLSFVSRILRKSFPGSGFVNLHAFHRSTGRLRA